MADWASITNSQVDPDAPLTSELAYAWRDNVIAMTEGAVGAPRIAFAAMGAWFSTAGAVGTYMWGRRTTGTAAVAFGSTLAGSSISPTAAAYGANSTTGDLDGSFPVGAAQAGTWRAMGTYTDSASAGRLTGSTLWLRIS